MYSELGSNNRTRRRFSSSISSCSNPVLSGNHKVFMKPICYRTLYLYNVLYVYFTSINISNFTLVVLPEVSLFHILFLKMIMSNPFQGMTCPLVYLVIERLGDTFTCRHVNMILITVTRVHIPKICRQASL